MHLAKEFANLKLSRKNAAPRPTNEMQVKTLLNHVHPCKGFVYGAARFAEDGEDGRRLEVELRPRKNSKPICSGCKRPASHYDTRPQRKFAFVPLWGIDVFLLYHMRRVDCPRCGVLVEFIPWAEGKSSTTLAYQWFLATWAKRLSWEETARLFRTSWYTVCCAVQMAVFWGLAHRKLDNVEAIGVDEVAWQKGHNYLTVVYQIDKNVRRLIWVGRERTEACLDGFFDGFGSNAKNLKFVCSDMWKPYLNVISRRANQAIHVLDRFHIAKLFSKAIDEVRAQEARKMKSEGYDEVLKNSRWSLLKRPENLTEKQEAKLKDLLRYNLKTVRAYLLKEDLQAFWTYVSPAWAEKFLDRWCTRVMRSKIEPMKKVASTLRRHKPLILNWFKARGEISGGATEGINNKLKVITRRSFGFRTFKTVEIALYHGLGQLPEPEGTHRFV